ncbi:hypothetical protein OH708_10945 [Pseudomonas capsici]|uniref:hypothetical protein n=1 Tax=Pseudomonas capsici TaxID=2810614 RepID=UPI0013C35A96|nr:hypothetical protein [Pseudomonas capsici]MBX8473157.1 hypothetical protein [Pseudomonas cichorii]MBX8606852.1 hypothetical protein [Pseudomonas cichorii]MCV4288421.1 hypothetical protein [Pseudomonas capsici]
MMKVLSYSLLTKTSEESHKKNIIHESPGSRTTPIVDETVLLGDSSDHLIGNTLPTLRNMQSVFRRKDQSMPAPVLDQKTNVATTAVFSGARSREQQRVKGLVKNPEALRGQTATNVFRRSAHTSEHFCALCVITRLN